MKFSKTSKNFKNHEEMLGKPCDLSFLTVLLCHHFSGGAVIKWSASTAQTRLLPTSHLCVFYEFLSNSSRFLPNFRLRSSLLLVNAGLATVSYDSTKMHWILSYHFTFILPSVWCQSVSVQYCTRPIHFIEVIFILVDILNTVCVFSSCLFGISTTRNKDGITVKKCNFPKKEKNYPGSCVL